MRTTESTGHGALTCNPALEPPSRIAIGSPNRVTYTNSAASTVYSADRAHSTRPAAQRMRRGRFMRGSLHQPLDDLRGFEFGGVAGQFIGGAGRVVGRARQWPGPAAHLIMNEHRVRR